MNDQTTPSASNDSATTAGSAPVRRKAPARRTVAARRGPANTAGTRTFGQAALQSDARAQNPQGDDPFQSGQRIWPD